MIRVTTSKWIETSNIRDVIANDNHVRDILQNIAYRQKVLENLLGERNLYLRRTLKEKAKPLSKRVFQRLPRNASYLY